MARGGRLLTLALVLCALAHATALQVKKRGKDGEQDDGVDRYGHMRVKPTPTFVAAGVATVAATALQVATPAWVKSTMGACETGFGAALLKFVTYINEVKVSNPLGLTMTHGLLLKAIAEVLSQVIPQAGASSAWLDPLRIVRSTIASLLSSSLTFYYWSRQKWLRALVAPGWLAMVLGKTFGTSLTKMVVTQAVYRPINVFLFLLAQSFFRGDSLRKMVDMMRSKFKNGVIGGIAFFAVSNMIMFSIPVPYLHPIIGAIAGLIFNVWLAMVAYQKDPSPAAAAAPSSALDAVADLVPESVAEFPVTAGTLGTIAALEGVAAAGLYAAGTARAAPNARGAGVRGDHVAPTPATVDAI